VPLINLRRAIARPVVLAAVVGWSALVLLGLAFYLGTLDAMADHPRLRAAPNILAMVCWGCAAIWGLISGPGAVRWAVIYWLGAFAMAALILIDLSGPPVMEGVPRPSWRPDPTESLPAIAQFAFGVAFLVFAVVQSIRAAVDGSGRPDPSPDIG
jgi:hypothetical protein